MLVSWDFALLIALVSLATALVALWIVSVLPGWPRAKGRAQTATGDRGARTVFLFEEGILLDATPAARRLLAQAPEDDNAWNSLCALLSPRFADFNKEMDRLADTGMAELDEVDGPARLRATRAGGVTRISLMDGDHGTGERMVDPHCLSALDSELGILRRVAARMPCLAWEQDDGGNIIWANRAYLALVERTIEQDETLIWPLPDLFPGDAPKEGRTQRQSVTLADGETRWFDRSRTHAAGISVHFALPADAIVQAETELGKFTQTLTKTFAGLPTGLAIFDRARRLVMFNPALVDLCMLDPQFLVARPTLAGFLDNLRDKRMIPEQKDYQSWREKITTLEREAETGLFQEDWTLPSGQTYRVTGQPHPDGALALLFEDISSEISLTRGFRAEIDMGQAVLDSIPEAIAVFSPAGVLTLSNRAYTAMWGSDPSVSLNQIGIHEASRLWESRCVESDLWNRIRDTLSGLAPRREGHATVRLRNGAALSCRVAPISGGATLVGFRQVDAKAKGEKVLSGAHS